MKRRYRVGDRVVRNKAVGSTGQAGDMNGTIVKVTSVVSGSGGTSARIQLLHAEG